MSKTILQEIATFNAEQFNAAKKTSEISKYQLSVDKYYEDSVQLINDNLHQYLVINQQTINSIDDKLSDLTTNTIQDKINLSVMEEFILTELSKNMFNLGVMRKEYRRNNLKREEDFYLMHRKPLNYFTGPVGDPTYDSEGNLIEGQYSNIKVPTDRDWMWVENRKLMYKGGKILSLNPAGTSILIGNSDDTNAIYKHAIFPGTVDIQNNAKILDGTLDIISPSSATNSITVNKAIRATTGLETINGYIKTGKGDISSQEGNLIINKGDGLFNQGVVKIISPSAATYSLEVNKKILSETGMDVTNGHVTIDTGNFIGKNGDVVLGNGHIFMGYTADNINSPSGNASNLYMSKGDITLTDGDILMRQGDIVNGASSTNFNWKLDSAGNGTFTNKLKTKLLEVTDTITVTNLEVNNTLDVGGTSEFGGKMIINNHLDVRGPAGSNGEVNANKFVGTATAALYADLAEKYQSDSNYPPGTVLSLGGNKEVTLYNPTLPLAGVVSTQPGLLLNYDKGDDYLYIALKGRIPVKTKQYIFKGMCIYPDPINAGYCIGVPYSERNNYSFYDLIGIAISDSSNGLVEAKI